LNATPIIDMHMHLFPRFSGLGQSRHYGRFVFDGQEKQALPPSFVNTDSQPEVALAYMDWCGVERAMLLQGPYHGSQNVFYLDVIQRWPDRFVAMAMVDPTEGEHAARELRRSTEDGCLGLKIEIDSLRRVSPHFEFLGKSEMKVWEVVAEKNLPVYLHLTQDERSLQEGEGMLALLKRWPELNFVVCHLGMPPFEGWQQRALLAQHPNIYADISAAHWFFQADQGETYPVPGGQRVLQWAVEHLGADKLLWGSDYPMSLALLTYLQMIDLVRVEATFLTDTQRAQILGGNARALLARWQQNRR
jgi:predicted TIM-barrel fold metal-dependent hydrolase